MSQQNSQQLYPSLPTYVFQQQQQQQQQEQQRINGAYSQKDAQNQPQQHVLFVQPTVNSTSATQPLLPQQVVYYPVYHPQRMVHYAKKSKRNCCCVCWSITCCCCLFIGIIIGATFGYLAWKCSQLDVTVSRTYNIDASNSTRFSFYAQDGDYSFQERTDGVNNVTVTVSRRTSSEDFLSNFNTSITNFNGEVSFVDTSSFSNWWNIALMFCMKAQVTVLVPPRSVEFYISNTNGDISFNGTFSSNYSSFLASTVNGDIYVENVQTSSFTVTNTNGRVEVNQVVANDMQTSNTNGGVDVYDSSVYSSVKASTSNGEINFSNLLCIGDCGNLDFTSTNGDVTVELANFLGSFDVRTTNGESIVTGNNLNYQENTSNVVVGSTQSAGTGNAALSTSNGDATLSLN